MSKFVALDRFDINQTDLNFFDRNYVSGSLQKAGGYLFEGVAYPQLYEVHARNGSDDRVLRIYGRDLVVNAQHLMTAGQINVIASGKAGAANPEWYAQGLVLSVPYTYPSFQSPENWDDLLLFMAAYSENDVITLSAFDDTMIGHAGDDVITGGAGNDTLDGGTGNDTAVYQGSLASASIERVGAVLRVTAPGEGTDLLTGFERIRFGSQTYDVAAIAGPADNTPPRVVSISPADRSYTPAPSKIVVQYDEDLVIRGGTIWLKTGLGAGDILETYSVRDAAHVTVSGHTLTIDPDSKLAEGQTYYVAITTGSVGDLSGNASDGINDVSFTVTGGADDWRLFASDGFAGRIGGSGTVFGTADVQDITVLDEPGFVALDPSFNRGGDIIRLHGNALDWRIGRSGSSAILNDGDTFVTIPLGTAGIAIVFDDGARMLKLDGSPKLGAQGFGTPIDVIFAAPQQVTLPTGINPQAQARMFLASGADASVAGNLNVFGTMAAEHVSIASGRINLDPSFNRGGDTIEIARAASDFKASRVGSTLFLDSATTDVSIPIGTKATELVFAGGDERALIFDVAAASLRLGDQLIGSTPVALTEFA